MILSDDFVFIHQPKTGGTFVTSVLERLLKSSGKTCVNINQHGTCDEIPAEYADRPIIGCVRNPYDIKVSQYRYEAWANEATPRTIRKMRKHFPRFPDLTFAEFLFAKDLMAPVYNRTARANGFAATMGQYSLRFMQTFFRQYRKVVPLLSEDFIASGSWREHLHGVHFLRTNHLNDDLHRFLLSTGYPGEHLEFILTAQKILPPGGTRDARLDTLESLYSRETKEIVREKERFIFSMFPEFDIEFSTVG